MKTFDADSSGSINYEEFRKQLRRCTCHAKSSSLIATLICSAQRPARCLYAPIISACARKRTQTSEALDVFRRHELYDFHCSSLSMIVLEHGCACAAGSLRSRSSTSRTSEREGMLQ